MEYLAFLLKINVLSGFINLTLKTRHVRLDTSKAFKAYCQFIICELC